MNDFLAPIIRRAILDLMEDIGGEQNDEVLTMLLVELGHRVARRDVADQLRWLAACTPPLVKVDEVGPYLAARVIADGRDVAAGRLRIDGVSRHKTGE